MDTNLNNSFAPRVATYSQDGLGLGHMRRTHLIARQFLGLRPDASVLTLSDSQMGQFFSPTPNHDYLKLPSIVKDGPGLWRAANLALPFDQVLAMRQELICSALLNYRPHVLLVDHMPHGAMGELLPALDALRASGLGTKIVLGLRDILDAPHVVQSRWQVEGAYAAVEEYYDQVLVYGMRSVYDLAEQYRFSPAVTERLRYCGYVCAPSYPATIRGLRAKLLRGSPAGTKLVVAMAGGGADAYPVMRALLDALPMMQRRQPLLLALVTGPFMPRELQEELKARAHGLPVRIFTAVDDTHSYQEAADLLVAMAGYNTTAEILQSGKRAILVPRRGPSAEQRTRTELFAARGWIEMLDPDELTAEALAPLVVKNLNAVPHVSPNGAPDLDGVHVAAQTLVNLTPAAGAPLGLREQTGGDVYELANHRR